MLDFINILCYNLNELTLLLTMSSLVIGASFANQEFNAKVYGTGSKTILTKTTKMRRLSLYVTTCKFTSFFSSDLDYELSSVYYSETQFGRTGNYYFNPYNDTKKTYYLTAQCQGVTYKTNISGNYNVTTMNRFFN